MSKLNNIRRFVAFSAVTVALLVTATILYRIQHGKTLSIAVRKLPVQIDVSLQAVHYTETQQGVKQWDLSADRAEYDREKGRTTLVKVNLAVLNSSAGAIRVTADRADYDNAAKDIFLVGNVHGASASGLEFSAQNVRYVASRRTIESREKVAIRNAGLSVEGAGMELETKTQRLKLAGGVSATVQPGAVRK